ncbi:hypothetical protein [Bosea sp. (in: a-proteobacteria)]|uniref:hypothetical protein n=1 Tax=Bosea sp. (in: a-proteobacteria) TaxID=1871050 RepID=UPI004033C074
MDILPDISVIQDDHTQKEVSKVLEILRSIGSTFHAEKHSSHILQVIEPQSLFLAGLFENFGADTLISDAKQDFIFDALRVDFREANDAYEIQLENQIKRYDVAFKKISKKYSIYPNKIEKNLLEKKLSRSRLAVYMIIDGTKTSKNSISENLSAIQIKILEHQKQFYIDMADIWKSIQEIEKYHNDHSRNILAKIALFVSVSWIVIGQSSMAIANIKKILEYLGILTGP